MVTDHVTTMMPLLDIPLTQTGAITVPGGVFGGTTTTSSIRSFACTGNEPSLSACPVGTGAPGSCSQAASVVCQLSDAASAGNCTHGDIRLVNGTSPINGRLELCVNNAWGTMCSNLVTQKEASVVCRQLNTAIPNIRVSDTG